MFVLSIHKHSSSAKLCADACSHPSQEGSVPCLFLLFYLFWNTSIRGFWLKPGKNPPDHALKRHGLRRVSSVMWLVLSSHCRMRDKRLRFLTGYITIYTGLLWGPFGPVLRDWARNVSKESSKRSQSWPNFIPSNSF